jgi:hypothetical protein
MKKKNGLLQTFFYDFLKSQVTNWVREILFTFENQSSIIYWFLLRYTVIIYKFTQGNIGAKKIARSRFQSPVKKKNRKLRHWRPTARSLEPFMLFNPAWIINCLFVLYLLAIALSVLRFTASGYLICIFSFFLLAQAHIIYEAI